MKNKYRNIELLEMNVQFFEKWKSYYDKGSTRNKYSFTDENDTHIIVTVSSRWIDEDGIDVQMMVSKYRCEIEEGISKEEKENVAMFCSNYVYKYIVRGMELFYMLHRETNQSCSGKEINK